jgi:NlpC/P60 family protein
MTPEKEPSMALRNPGLDPHLWDLVLGGSQKYGLDPYAVAAISRVEGGGRYGAVGDQGTSFGPFQLHRGGALPAGKGANWANSPAGVMYALRQMASSGAKGKRGKAAITAIAANFERPADVAGEIQKALGYYRQAGGGSGADVFARGMAAVEGGQQAIGFTQPQLGLLAQVGPLSARVANELSAMSTGGTLSPPISGKTGFPPGLAPGGKLNPKVKGILAFAHNQIGQDYVWGGESRKEGGFDCSGLIQAAYAKMGISLPRVAADQGRAGREVNYKNLRPGDLIVAKNGSHIVMYVGGGKVIAAPHRGAKVRYQPLSDFPSKTYHARRIL